MMNNRKALLLISASGLLLMPCGIAQAAYSPRSSLPDAITSVYNTHFTYTSHPEETLLSSYTSHPEETLLSSCEDFNFITLTRPWQGDLSPQGRGKKDKIKLAATCFVTDTSACSGNEFSGNNADDDGHGSPGGPGNGDDYELDNKERCNKEGYYLTSCPNGQEGSGFCPYDSSYFEKCVSTCPSNYVTCEPPYYGVVMASVRLVTENMPLAKKTPSAPVRSLIPVMSMNVAPANN